jgi:hypothetical protein
MFEKGEGIPKIKLKFWQFELCEMNKFEFWFELRKYTEKYYKEATLGN